MAQVTSSYARAFADVVVDRGLDPARTVEHLRALAQALESSPELQRVWENPAVSAEQKRGVLDGLVASLAADPMLRNFVAVLIDRRRISSLAQIATQFERELNARLGMSEAEITSARELSTEEKQALVEQIERLTGRKVRARYQRDDSLLGGAIVRLGSTIYDGSVKGQLRRIREELSS